MCLSVSDHCIWPPEVKFGTRTPSHPQNTEPKFQPYSTSTTIHEGPSGLKDSIQPKRKILIRPQIRNTPGWGGGVSDQVRLWPEQIYRKRKLLTSSLGFGSYGDLNIPQSKQNHPLVIGNEAKCMTKRQRVKSRAMSDCNRQTCECTF